MSSPVEKGATYDDLRRVPEHLVAELLAGELHTQPRPAGPHAFATSGLGADLVGPFQRGRGGPGGWFIIDEPEVHLSGDVLVPDMAGWRRERLPAYPDEPHVELAPDWVLETLSPATAGRDRTIKLEIYRREGVPHLWYLDPRGRSLEVLRLDGDSYRIAATFLGDVEVRAEPFDAVAIDLSQLWLSPTE